MNFHSENGITNKFICCFVERENEDFIWVCAPTYQPARRAVDFPIKAIGPVITIVL
jgi:hypothetical protein